MKQVYETDRSYWSVRCGIPTEFNRQGTYMANTVLGVVAPTIDEAIAEVRSKVPGVVVWGVSHGGRIAFTTEVPGGRARADG